ncbi:hypothetical protein N431DRAFT_427740 [Stipitochalara longipes BDJ]|nr:hypothetical protein N431DRAFT_427740 [Stipitochalara longipes BDJ]
MRDLANVSRLLPLVASSSLIGRLQPRSYSINISIPSIRLPPPFLRRIRYALGSDKQNALKRWTR